MEENVFTFKLMLVWLGKYLVPVVSEKMKRSGADSHLEVCVVGMMPTPVKPPTTEPWVVLPTKIRF